MVQTPPQAAQDSQLLNLRVPPHSIEAEQSVLGGLLLDNQAFDKIADVVAADDFYRDEHRRIYMHIQRLIERSKPADVLTIYLLPEVNLMVRPRILDLKPGTRLVSHDYGFGEWPPDVELTMDAPGKSVGRDQKSKVMYWVVPSRVAGKWVWQDGKSVERFYELQIDQVFQKISGTVSFGGRSAKIEDAVLTGDNIRFTAALDIGGKPVSHEFNGKVVNNAITGEARVAGAAQVWSATRTELREARFTDLKPGITAR